MVWYVAYCKPRKEECAQYHIERKGLEVFYPKLLLPEAGRLQRRVVPLFPNYIFVRMRIAEEYPLVRWSPGVKRLVNVDGEPIPLDEGIVSFLMGQADQQGMIRACSNLRVGQEVLVTDGPLAGLVGVIQEPPDSRARVKLLLTLLKRQVKVEVPVRFLETGQWVTQPATQQV